MKLSYLWAAPEVNPINRKARSVPFLNVFNVYGRVFFFSWWGFMVAFWAWYAFPPLVSRLLYYDISLLYLEKKKLTLTSVDAHHQNQPWSQLS